MTFITGEQLLLLAVPEQPRRQLADLMDYLNRPNNGCMRVCALYGLRRTGKTTLLLQAIRQLLAQGVPADQIGYFTGMKSDTFDDLYLELEAQKGLRYIFIDEIGFFANFLQNGNYLYDTLVRLYGKKVVIAGTNLLALYVASKNTLYDRCEVIRVPYLSFYEHCKFVLQTTAPSYGQFVEYMKSGGLFQPPEDIVDYVQTSIVNSIVELFETQPEKEVFVWLKPESDKVDWKGYVNTALFLSTNYVSSKSFQAPVSLIHDAEVLDAQVTRRMAQEFKDYFSLSRKEREEQMKKSETVALLDFLVHCGVITVLPNLYGDTEPYKCYVQAPFLRFHFTEKLRRMADAQIADEHKPLFGDLVEAAVVSEYQLSHPTSDVCFARTHCPPGGDLVAEIDLIDRSEKQAFEVKLTDGHGYKGFSLLSDRKELQGCTFTLLEGEECMRQIYRWGEASYEDKTT